MKKIIISAALLGVVSLTSMAFIGNGHDNPPVRSGNCCQGSYACEKHQGGHNGQPGKGGCCGKEKCYDSRRDGACCDYQKECGACRDNCCTAEGCQKDCKQCAPCADNHKQCPRNGVCHNK